MLISKLLRSVVAWLERLDVIRGREKNLTGFITPSVPGRVMSCSPVGGMQCRARTVVIRGDFAVSRQSGIIFSSITGRIGTLTYSA